MTHLFVNVYTDPDFKRDAELKEAFARNKANPLLTVHGIDGRPTFDEMFAFANEVAGDDDVCIVANSDICFDNDHGFDSLGRDDAFALTRWDTYVAPGHIENVRIFADDNGIPRIDSQDAWVWRGKCKVEGADFTPGIRGCDNHLTYLFHKSGYKVSNPSLSIVSVHLHRSDVRRYGHNDGDCIPKPYLLIAPHKLGEKPTLDIRF